MQEPLFKLEGIIKAKDEMADFEGPLELILQLLSKNKVEIKDISISLILEQYLEYLEKMAELDLEIASEFITMASHLTYIKTKMLLSGGEEVTELSQLIFSLEELAHSDVYLQIKSAAQALSIMYSRDGVMMTSPPEYLPEDTQYRYSHSSGDLFKAILDVVGRENAFIGSINPRETVYPQRVVFSIPEKISDILEKLKKIGDMTVTELFRYSGSRTEIIATLVALLELCRVGSILLTGEPDDIKITYTGTGREPETSDFTEDQY